MDEGVLEARQGQNISRRQVSKIELTEIYLKELLNMHTQCSAVPLRGKYKN